jgi:hypothetical protein
MSILDIEPGDSSLQDFDTTRRGWNGEQAGEKTKKGLIMWINLVGMRENSCNRYIFRNVCEEYLQPPSQPPKIPDATGANSISHPLTLRYQTGIIE